MKNRPFLARLRFAAAGIRIVWQRERSFRTQALVAGSALIALWVTRASLLWAAIFALSIALVLALEMVNSALEYLIDQVHPGIAAEIGHAKDAAAGAVLIASIAAIAVGVALLFATW